MPPYGPVKISHKKMAAKSGSINFMFLPPPHLAVRYATGPLLWWLLSPAPIHGPGILRDTVDKRAARILLECFLVKLLFTKTTVYAMSYTS